MLTKLFNSEVKVKLIQFFLSNQGVVITSDEAAKRARLTKVTANTMCTQLVKLGFLQKEMAIKISGKARTEHKKKGYIINTEFALFEEIRALFMKSQILFEGNLISKIKKFGGAIFIVLTGVFTGSEDVNTTDLLIVGKVNRDKLTQMIQHFEKRLGFEINYTVMSRTEYLYRSDITDRFLYSILEGKHIVILDKLRANY